MRQVYLRDITSVITTILWRRVWWGAPSNRHQHHALQRKHPKFLPAATDPSASGFQDVGQKSGTIKVPQHLAIFHLSRLFFLQEKLEER